MIMTIKLVIVFSTFQDELGLVYSYNNQKMVDRFVIFPIFWVCRFNHFGFLVISIYPILTLASC